jgi:hypothetical protein
VVEKACAFADQGRARKVRDLADHTQYGSLTTQRVGVAACRGILRPGLAPLLLPRPDQGLLVLPYDDQGIGADDEVTPMR